MTPRPTLVLKAKYLATTFYSPFKVHAQASKYITGVYFWWVKYIELEYLKITQNSQFLPQFSQKQGENFIEK